MPHRLRARAQGGAVVCTLPDAELTCVDSSRARGTVLLRNDRVATRTLWIIARGLGGPL